MKTVRVVIRGRVQGVWFRGWTERRARERGLDGWVRNRRDGAVEALFSGPGNEIDAMVADCAKGPPAARVDTVDAEPADPPGTSGFRTQASE